MYLLQGFYSLILNPIFKITGKIDERIRNAVITLCCLFLTGFFVAYYDAANRLGLSMEHTKNSLICGSVLIILVVFSIKAPLTKFRWDPILFYLFFIAGLGITAISFLHPVGSGYRAFGLMMMFGFPCLYYVWNNRGDYDTLYKRLSFAACVVGLMFYALCIKLAVGGELSITSGRVNGPLQNANMFSMIGMVMVCSALYIFMACLKSTPWFILGTASFAVGWEIIFLGVSRLSILVGAGSILAFLIFGFKKRTDIVAEQGRLKTYLKSIIILVVMILVMISGSILLTINDRNTPEQSPAGSAGSEAHTEETEGTPEDDTVSATDRFDTSDKSLDTYTAGRISLWTSYASHLNMWGNSFDQSKMHEVTGCSISHAHNNFLEIAYRCGIPVACIHILLELYAGIICIVFLFGKKYREPYHLFAVIFMICYAVESMFDIATIPFERQAPFFFYMALIPLFGRKAEEEEKMKC